MPAKSGQIGGTKDTYAFALFAFKVICKMDQKQFLLVLLWVLTFVASCTSWLLNSNEILDC